MPHKGSRGKPCRTNFTDSKKRGAIEGPIKIPLDSSLFLFNALALLSISSKFLEIPIGIVFDPHRPYQNPIKTVLLRCRISNSRPSQQLEARRSPRVCQARGQASQGVALGLWDYMPVHK